MPSPQATTSLSPAAATAPTAAPGPKGLRMVHGGIERAKTAKGTDQPGISRERKGGYAELPNRERDGGTAAAVPRPGGSRRAARRGADRARHAPRDRPPHRPGGGVVVPARVAARRGSPLDVVAPRKVGAPGTPELAVGAVADGVQALDEPAIRRLGLDMAAVRAEAGRPVGRGGRAAARHP